MSVLRIELLEDCSMNSGRVVNTYFSDDVYFDGFGLPYIPAWVIRNSLIRTAERAGDPIRKETFELLTGDKEKLILDDALSAGIESMRQALLSAEDLGLRVQNPQSVLNASGFVKIKKTSGINGEKHVRMLARGTFFEAHFSVKDEYLALFKELVGQTRCLYVGHDVFAGLSIDEERENPAFDIVPPEIDFCGDDFRLEYELHILSRVTTLDRISGELSSDAFITGSSVHEALSARPDLRDIFCGRESRVRCSFAYIKTNKQRGLPIPASYSTKKQDKNDLRDRCSLGRRADDYDQIKGVGTLFIDDPDGTVINAMNVRKEQGIIQYYEDEKMKERPYTAIAMGQTFKGFIEGEKEDILRIYKDVTSNGYMRIGDMNNLGFGSAFMQVTKVKPLQARESVLAEEITVLLASPARLYCGGLYEASAENVKLEIERLPGIETELEIVRNSQKTCCLSEYNKVWDEYEPLEYAMQSGSVYRMRAKNGRPLDLSAVMGSTFIGKHNETGYGEVIILPAVDLYYRRIEYSELPEKGFPLKFYVDPNPGRRLMRSLFQHFADTVSSYRGASMAEEFVLNEFKEGPLKEIEAYIGDDYDEEQVFEIYMDALKKSGLNAIRRMRHA